MASITLYPSTYSYDRSIKWSTTNWAKVTQDSDSSAYNGGWATRVGGGYDNEQFVTWIPFPTGTNFLDPAKYVISAATLYLYQGYVGVSDINNVSSCMTTMRVRGGTLTPSGTNAFSGTTETKTAKTVLSSATAVGYHQYSFDMTTTAKALQSSTATGIYVDLSDSSNTTYYGRFYSGYNASGTQYKTTQSPRFVVTYSNRAYKLSTPSVTGATVTGSGTYEWGGVVTVKCTPAAGYRFVKWQLSGGSTATATSATFKFTMPTADTTATAVVEKVTYTVSGTAGNSTLSGTGSYKYQSSVKISCTPNAGYKFKSFVLSGGISKTVTTNPYTFTMPAGNVSVAVVLEYHGLIYVAVNGTFKPYLPYASVNNQWVRCLPRASINGTWKDC